MLGSGTLRDNVTIGLDDVAQSELDELAQAVGVRDVVLRSQLGWDQCLGDEGQVGYKSGGQQQRFALWRALIRRPSVLPFHEPTAHLDEDLTAQFLKLLDRFGELHNHTDHHDPVVARFCDQLITIDETLIVDGERRAIDKKAVVAWIVSGGLSASYSTLRQNVNTTRPQRSRGCYFILHGHQLPLFRPTSTRFFRVLY